MKKIIIVVLVVALLLGVYLMFMRNKTTPLPIVGEVKSFEDCEKAGYPVMESQPRQCRTPDGRTYAEEIMPPIQYSNATNNNIVVESPFPGAVTGK